MEYQVGVEHDTQERELGVTEGAQLPRYVDCRQEEFQYNLWICCVLILWPCRAIACTYHCWMSCSHSRGPFKGCIGWSLGLPMPCCLFFPTLRSLGFLDPSLLGRNAVAQVSMP